MKVFVFSAYLRTDGPQVKVRLTLADQNEGGDWRARIEAVAAKDPKAAKPPQDTISAAGEATLGATWQRVAARLELDARRQEQSLVGALTVVEGVPATVLADGLQLEQTCIYPLTNTDPTSWIPGGETRGPAWIDLAARETVFTGERGTLGCWVRPLPDQCGGTRSVRAILTLGTGWWTPAWQLGGNTWYVGEAPTKQKHGKLPGAGSEKALFELGQCDGWHALTLAWDEQEAVGYLDGKPFARTPLEPGRPAHGTLLRMGGSFLEHTPMTGDLDDVFLYGRRLSDAEIAALAAAQSPLAASLPRFLLRRPVRLAFLRSEPEARIDLEPAPYAAPTAEASVTAAVPGLKAEVSAGARLGKPLELVVKPWLRAPGKYALTVHAKSGQSEVAAAEVVEVFEEPAGREFIIYAWGGTDADLEERGFNCLFGEPRSLLERGLWANITIHVREGVPHPWSPRTRVRAQGVAARVARAAMAHPNVRACLVNTECSHPPFPADEPWFLEWMRQAGLQTTYYSDQPEAAKQFEAMDLVDFWAYPKCPEGLVARFSHASCLARLDGKPFQAMPGTIYWDDGNGLWLNDEDGKRKVLCLSPDCLKENLWISVACRRTCR